jgi:hypothetical protein
MDRPEFDITIDPSGKVWVEIKGVQGPRCLKYADLVREIVGREDERRLTAEFYQPDSQVRIDARAEQRLSRARQVDGA